MRLSKPEVSSATRRGAHPPGLRRLVTGVLVLLTGTGGWWWALARSQPAERTVPSPAGEQPPPVVAADGGPARFTHVDPFVPGALPPEKAARVAAILSDYDAMRTRVSAEHETLGDDYPGGLNAFLRQLALLEREKRLDLAAALTPGELEDFERRESPAGQTVQELLAHTAASDEQQRTVFRLQREFDDRFALSFDATPAAAWERERARVELQEKIGAALGESLFALWLRGEGADYGRFSEFVAQHQLPPSTALELWRIKSDYTLRRLELNARSDPLSAPASVAHRELMDATSARLQALLGSNVLSHAGPELLSWLPKR